MEDCAKVNTLIEYRVKISKNNKKDKLTSFKSLVRSLIYLTWSHPDILFGVWLGSRFMKTSTITHFKALKQILYYIKGTINFS
jgi:hypothetical protein